MDPTELIKKFNSPENLYLLSPYLSAKEKERILSVWKKKALKDHVFLCSSGTSSGKKIKTYALSKKALTNNAIAVNELLKANASDKWLSSLPYYHVGGLSIFVRAMLSQSVVIPFTQKWMSDDFVKTLLEKEVQFASLVPAQLYDIVNNSLRAPSCVKGLFLGGDFLSPKLKELALDLDWPLIETYGCTELCSQIASSFCQKGINDYIEVLPLHKIVENKGRFSISSSSMFSLEMLIDSESVLTSYANNSKFLLPDNLKLKNEDGKQYIKTCGRLGDEFKYKGRLINLQDLKSSAQEVFINYKAFGKADIILEKDERAGMAPVLMIESSIADLKDLLIVDINSVWNKTCRLERLFVVDKIEKTNLGKIKRI